MSEKENPYERVKGGRLTFKGGTIASRSKTIDKKKKKKHKNKQQSDDEQQQHHQHQHQHQHQTDDVNVDNPNPSITNSSGEVIYTIDAAKKLKYEECFPVEARKFGYDPKFNAKSIEDALDDRVKKKADRYCK